MARERSYQILHARPAEAEARLSFATLRDLLDPVLDNLSDRLPPPQRQALAIALLRDSPGGVPERSGVVEAGFLTCLIELAAEGPVLAAIDDVQWLDRPSRRVLEYAARRLAGTQLALMVTTRMETDVHGPLGLDRALHESRLRRIRVGPLSLGALHALLLGRIGAPFPRPVLRRIHERRTSSVGDTWVSSVANREPTVMSRRVVEVVDTPPGGEQRLEGGDPVLVIAAWMSLAAVRPGAHSRDDQVIVRRPHRLISPGQRGFLT